MSVLSVAAVILAVFAALLALGLVAGLFYLFWKVLRGVFWLIGRALCFVKSEIGDAIHTLGALLTACATVPLAAVNFVILRMGAARHYARAFADELKGVGVGLWRVALGNPLRFVGLWALVDGVERRLPDAMERAPRTRRARRATFEGYDVIGTLPSGGSGAQLFVARPKNATERRFLKAGRSLPAEVVIKSFALEAGSTLPQIVRESRALEAASQLGLVCEHQLSDDHFFYVMPYVKGEDLERVTRALHARGTPEGLADAELGLVLGYAIDLCDSLQRFHSGGLWHKDVKPTNVIVAKGRAHLVDFGLVTPLASALTLTTHGTEYYRDPEMVRLAMQGVKVHEVDGVRFDVYSAGAVLYSLLENCFPAHGSLSRLSKRAPEALRWIVQRAMAELGSRYGSASDMRVDLAALAAATNPFELRPADLPSFARAGAAES
ncbi:MAG: protein kinase, partial [Planctomycetes bacterium]|nr:protein kinase [Planctomycetota bacterium]